MWKCPWHVGRAACGRPWLKRGWGGGGGGKPGQRVGVGRVDKGSSEGHLKT